MLKRFTTVLMMFALLGGHLGAQEPLNLPEPGNERMFGFEFEFAGQDNRITSFDKMPWENYEKLMRIVVEHYGGNPADIKRVDFMKPTENLEKFPTGERPLFRAEWRDSKNRKWMIEPEYVQSTGLDGYEMVTPPLDDPKDLREIIDKIAASGMVKEGLKSGVHLNIDGRKLTTGNDARALTNLILMHESYEPMLRRLFRPVRGGGPTNRFARSIATDHEGLLRELDALPQEERTREKLEELFNQRTAREAALHEAEIRGEGSWTKLWKYRSLNLAKVLQVNEMHNGKAGVVEFRMFDLDVFKNPEAHELQAKIYRAMVREAELMAERGETFKYRPRVQAPEGSDIAVYNTPKDPAEAKLAAAEMLRTMGLNPTEFTGYLDKTLVREVLPSRMGINEVLSNLTDKKIVHNGKAFTYGFEFEGRGSDVVKIMVPTDAEARAAWDAKSVAEKKAYYRSTVGDRVSTVDAHFEPDTRLWWLDPYWYMEGTGNWEIHSKVFDNLEEAMRAMREAKKLAAASGKGFHLHMRDNAPDWEMLEKRGSQFADWTERASDWVWLQRARRLKTMIGIKSWSNARINPAQIEGLSKLESMGYNRATIRTQIKRSENFVDVEIRGLTKWVDDIELLAKLIGNSMVTGNFGEWKHTDNQLKGNTKGQNSVNFTDFMEDYVRTVEGKSLTPAERRVYDRLQHDYLAKTDSGSRLSATQLNVATPLQPWHMDQALDPYLRRDLYFRQQDYARSLRFTLNKVMNGAYGVDMDVISAQGLTELMDIAPELAEKLVTARELAGGKMDIAEALRMVASGDPAKLSRLSRVELNTTDAILGERLGLSPEDVSKLRTHTNALDMAEALTAAGVEDARMLEVIERSGVIDMNTIEAEALAKRLGLTPTETARFLAYRNANEVTSAEEVRKAGVSEAGVERVTEAMTRSVDLNAANQAKLVELGLTAEEAAKVVAARRAQYFRTYEDLAKAGVDARAIETLRESHEVNKRKLNTLSVEELERAGISRANAEKIARYRTGITEFTPELLGEVIGDRTRGNELAARSQPLDLTTANVDQLVERGVSQRDAERLVRYARTNSIGSASSLEGWESLFQELREKGVIRGARRVRDLSTRAEIESAELETARPETLERYGLTETEAKNVVRLRDAQPLTAEALVEGGFSEAEAKRMAGLVEGVDPRSATLSELEARTGLDRASLERVIALSGTAVDVAPAEALAERFGISEAKAKRLVSLRDGRTFAEALEEVGHANKLDALVDQAKGVALGSEKVAIAELARRLQISRPTARKIVRFRDAHDLNTTEALRQAGLSQAEAERILPLLGEGDVLRVAEAPAELGLSAAETKALEIARTAVEFGSFPELVSKGVDLTTVRALQNSDLTVEEAKRLSVEEIVERANISPERARELVRVTQVHDVESLKGLEEVLGKERAREVYTKAKVRSGSNLAELTRAFGEATAKKLFNFREAHSFGAYDIERSVNALVENGVIRGDVANKIRTFSPKVDLEKVTVEELTGPRFKLPVRLARRLVALRDSKPVRTVEELRELGLTKGEATRLVENAKPIELETASAEDLRRAGFSEAQSNELVELREKIKTAPELNAQEISKQMRFKVKKWAQETDLAEGLLRSLIPEAREGEVRFAKDLPGEVVEREVREGEVREGEARRGVVDVLEGNGEAFSKPRERAGSNEVSTEANNRIRSVFNAVRSSALARWEARIYGLPEGASADRTTFERGREALQKLELEVVRSSNVEAQLVEGKVQVSIGLWNELVARGGANGQRAAIRGLALILGHELAHAGGIKVERPADIEGLRIARDSAVGEKGGKFTRAEIRDALAAFDKPLGSSRLSNVLYRMKNLVRYGRVGARARALEATVEGKAEADPFAQYRRADGTARWGQVARARTVGEIKGGAHFALALFFKEVSVLVASGDRERMEEFFDYLASTDFYKHYGLFVVGARVGEVAYVKSLQRYVKPKFVNSLLKTSLVLGAGIALPMIVEGTFEYKAFTITLGSLGLSSALVKGAVSGGKKIRGLMTVKEAQATGKLARAGRMARLGGWVYTAAELAVVLILAEEIEGFVHHKLDERAAKAAIREAGQALLSAVRDPDATPETVEAAARTFHEVYGDWRNFLYAPIQAEEMWLAQKAEGMAEKAKEAEDKRNEVLSRVDRLPNLKRRVLADHGSLEGYADHLVAEDETELTAVMNGYLKTFNERREDGLRAVYEDNERGTPLVRPLSGSALAALTAAEGTGFSRVAKPAEVKAFESALGSPSKNRFESYGDESLLLEQIERSLRATDRVALADAIKGVNTLVGRTLIKDQELVNNNGQVSMDAGSEPAALPDVPRMPGEAEAGAAEQLEDVLPDYPAIAFLKSEGRVLGEATQGAGELGVVQEGGAVFATGPAADGFVPVEFDGTIGFLPAVQIEFLR